MISKNFFKPVFANDLDAWVPEIWANESVALLVENMVVANLVHRDFQNEIAQYGDIVNTRSIGTFEGKRKNDAASVIVQDASATNIAVPLDQHIHVSFRIRDGEESKSFKSLVTEYLEPAIIAIGQTVDKIILGQHVHFIGNTAGGIGETSSSNAVETLIDLRKTMNDNKAYLTGRNLVLGPALEATMLKDEVFHEADKVGDDGTALREASLGRKIGFNIFMCQNMSEFTYADIAAATAVAVIAVADATTLYLDSTAAVSVGDMITVAGDMVPQRVTASTDTSVTGSDVVTITPGLRDAVAVDAAVNSYLAGAVDVASDEDYSSYAVNHYDYIRIGGFTAGKLPQVGQQIYLAGTVGYTYTIIDIDTPTYNSTTDVAVLLDRPLDELISGTAVASLYPSGNYGFAFHRNALAFVSRPLAAPRAGTGALSAVANYNDVGIRIVITYDGVRQGHLVTVDLLCGVKVLDTNLGAVLLG